MKTEAERQAARDAYKIEKQRAQAEYDNFRYTDAQREQTIEFIGQAMRVVRGDADLDSLRRLLPVIRTGNGWIVGYDNSTRLSFDARYLNRWTGIKLSVVPKPRLEGGSSLEPVVFKIDFAPEMDISRERLEALLQLKVVPGWTADGGNLRYELPQLHDLPPFNGGVFVYPPLKPPPGDFTLEVILTYLNGPDRDPYRASALSHLEITRHYLTPEQIRQRDQRRFGHLPRTGDLVPKEGIYLAVFADDALTAGTPPHERTCSYPVGRRLGVAYARNPVTGERCPLHAWWQWIAPDRFADEMNRLFPWRTQE